MPTHEKLPLKSKKFVAYLLADMSWTAITLYMLWILHQGLVSQSNGDLNSSLASLTTLIMAVTITSGFVQAMYIGGQSAVDAYTRVAGIVAGVKPGSHKLSHLTEGNPAVTPEDGDSDA
jgi:hypothetical protein